MYGAITDLVKEIRERNDRDLKRAERDIEEAKERARLDERIENRLEALEETLEDLKAWKTLQTERQTAPHKSLTEQQKHKESDARTGLYAALKALALAAAGALSGWYAQYIGKG